MAVSYWSECMARDTDRAHEEHLETLRDQALADIEQLVHSNGGWQDHPLEPCWLD